MSSLKLPHLNISSTITGCQPESDFVFFGLMKIKVQLARRCSFEVCYFVKITIVTIPVEHPRPTFTVHVQLN
ncbi:MAG: hypothetical protein LBC74_13820 [Planctomycetaceae bacterium]|nr:hypothetical protein [Planctomycetaceae bacterium]